MSLLEKARSFAEKHHAGQIRRGSGKPYVTHPIRVCEILKRYTTKETILISSLLHDTLEDCPGVTFQILKEEFGAEVAQNVLALTNDPEQVKSMGKSRYLCQKIQTLNYDQLLIKLADRLDNVADSPRPEYLIATKELLACVGYDTKDLVMDTPNKRD